MSDLLPIDEEKAAIDRIARSADGLLLHRYLRRVLETVIDLQDDGTLRTWNGRRSLARDLMVLMAPGIEGSSDRSGSSADEPILRIVGQPNQRGGSRSDQRRAVWAAERDAANGAEPA